MNRQAITDCIRLKDFDTAKELIKKAQTIVDTFRPTTKADLDILFAEVDLINKAISTCQDSEITLNIFIDKRQLQVSLAKSTDAITLDIARKTPLTDLITLAKSYGFPASMCRKPSETDTRLKIINFFDLNHLERIRGWPRSHLIATIVHYNMRMDHLAHDAALADRIIKHIHENDIDVFIP